jgi:hypothetical protein
MKLKSLVKIATISLCVFTSVPALAWHCTATNGRQSGTWDWTAPNLGVARQNAVAACRNASRTMAPGSCHIVTCEP